MAARSPELGFPLTIDTHAHLTMPEFDADREDAIERARSSGVTFLEVGFDAESSLQAVALSRELGGKCAVGIHPHYAGDSLAGLSSAWREVEKLLSAGNPEIVAIGEIGLDFWRNLSARDIQTECFSAGLELAKRKLLPVIIHQREAEREVLSRIKAAGLDRPVVFHCFTGDELYARRCLDLGGYLGFGGPLTYPRNASLRETVRRLPRGRILLETDSPYLAPQSLRGKRNEPSFVLEVRDLAAGLLALSSPSLSETTTANASKAFLADLAWPGM
jgi:TatD DNase family protein